MKQRERDKINFNFKNNKLKKGFIVTISTIAILAIIYFISEEFFYDITSFALAILVIVLPVLIISSPFILMKKNNKKPTKKDIYMAVLVSFMYLIVIFIIYYFLALWFIIEVSRALFSTF